MKLKNCLIITSCFATALLHGNLTPVAAREASAPLQNEVIPLWKGTPPGGATSAKEKSYAQPTPWGKSVQMLTDVSTPTMTVVRPAAGKATGAAMIVLPGGGFVSLAWDMEGTEVANWLAARGITAFVVKYRVALPTAEEMKARDRAKTVEAARPRLKIAVADASRAMTLVRTGAAKWGIDPDRIGMMGFSAGAVTTMDVVLGSTPELRPNFAAPIYGMTLLEGAKAPADAPPLFIVHAQDDAMVPVSGSVAIFDLWTAAKRPADLHIYSKGGHGFGMRGMGLPVDVWSADFEHWLDNIGMLKPASAKKPS